MWYDPSLEACDYLPDALTIFVVGASGDLAKKKTFPSLLQLYCHGFLTKRTTICGYARSPKTDEEFKNSIKPYLTKANKTSPDDESNKIDAFLELCLYRHGAYDSIDDVARVFDELQQIEAKLMCGKANRLFYFAIPPSVFVPIGKSIKEAVIMKANPKTTGWSRLIVEKPFGRDLQSFQELSDSMSALYSEDYIYRIDHYLGKEMVQNLVILRFSNVIFEPLWNHRHIKSVIISFKEDFGTQGRGGYFDNYGIIRDILQNHLLQVLCLVAMEPPVAVTGDANSANYVRDEKVKVLHCIDPVQLQDCVLGQYLAAPDGREVAYTEDPTVPNDSVTPTFCSMVLRINNPRWQGVPFILKAGKALNERKAEIRIQFKEAPGGSKMFAGQDIPSQELVMRLQPDEAVYLKTNVKNPGLTTEPVASELDLSYKHRFEKAEIFDAYTRLILEVIRGRQATFVRDDELKASWAIFTPLLKQIEEQRIKPILYEYGSRGPPESDELIKSVGYDYHGGKYKWSPNSTTHDE